MCQRIEVMNDDSYSIFMEILESWYRLESDQPGGVIVNIVFVSYFRKKGFSFYKKIIYKDYMNLKL